MLYNDIFMESPLEGWKVEKYEGLAINTSGLHDNWDELEGWYCYHLGEILDGQYQIVESLGSGVFSTVVRTNDSKATKPGLHEVVIKIIHTKDTMHKTGLNEVEILKRLAGAYVENKKRCIQLLSSFEYRNHICLVFELLHMNLRKVLNKYGHNIGLNLMAIQFYAKHIFLY